MLIALAQTFCAKLASFVSSITSTCRHRLSELTSVPRMTSLPGRTENLETKILNLLKKIEPFLRIYIRLLAQKDTLIADKEAALVTERERALSEREALIQVVRPAVTLCPTLVHLLCWL